MTRFTALKTLFPVLIIAIPVICFSQANYKNGFIISAKGDTSKGLIDLKEWRTTPQSITFKKEENSKPEKLGLNELQSFSIIGNGSFEKHTVNISLGAIGLADLSTEKDTTSETRTIFLQLIETGKNVSLYKYTDNIKTRFYIQKAGLHANPEELQYRPYLKNREISGAKVFANQLHLLAVSSGADSPRLRAKLETIEYRETEVRNIIQEINGSRENAKHREKTSTSRFVAGIFSSTASLVYKGDHQLAKDGATHAFAHAPGIAFGYDLFENKQVQKMMFRFAGAACMQRASTTENSYNFNTLSYRTANHDMEYLHISLNPQILYNVYNKPQFKTFFAAGVTAFRNVYLKNESVDAYGLKKTNKEMDLRKMGFSYSAAAGIQMWKKIECYVKYTPSLELNSNVNYSMRLRQKWFGINYLFK
ncbi:hypothetical protein [Pedobacter sp. SYSU D00535]|uniref:hypothetical protein n=1 Tax=Pedobacter sp. SYSU D00535 TaxID=2810308 RepID=UPI001A960229|nr:hypothetical protein [Pedobacter sp. SYSU D00535]